jgi:hypothetical protein
LRYDNIILNSMDDGNLFTGAVLRDAGIAQVLSHNPDWNEAARGFYLRFLQPQTANFSTDDFRDFTDGKLADPKESRCWGAFWRSMAEERHMVPTGIFVKSRRPERHCGVLELWRKP